MITNRQKKKIHTIVHTLEMSDKDYRGLLRKWFEVETCLKLNYGQAEVCIQRLAYIAAKTNKWEHREDNRTKYNELGRRPGMASPAQLRMIEAMWADVSYQKTSGEKGRALDRFIFNYFHISSLRFLESRQAKKIIRVLEEMEKSKGSPVRSTPGQANRSSRSSEHPHAGTRTMGPANSYRMGGQI